MLLADSWTEQVWKINFMLTDIKKVKSSLPWYISIKFLSMLNIYVNYNSNKPWFYYLMLEKLISLRLSNNILLIEGDFW